MADEPRTFTQDEVNKLVGDARVKTREQVTAQATIQIEKDRAETQEASLVANQEWQKLAEQHKARATELEPLVQRIEVYEELTKALLKDKIEALGDAAKTAIAGLPTGMTSVDKLSWLNTNAGLFSTKGNTGVGTPKRKTQTQVETKDEPRRVNSL